MKNTGSNYHEQIFRTKFRNAGKCLGVTPDQVISLKLRDMVSSYSEYREMLEILEHEAGIQSSPIREELQGQGHIVSQGDQKIIVVEHETGLEILYIAGSIASLIGLIPLVLQSWGRIRRYLDRRHANHTQGIEIRRIDAAGKLHEEKMHDLPLSSAFPLIMLDSTLLKAARILETELQTLRQEVQSQNERLASVEKEIKASKKVTTKKQTDKKSSNKTLKEKTRKQ